MSKLIKPDPFGFHVAQGVVTAGRVALLCKNALTPGEEGEILSPDLPQWREWLGTKKVMRERNPLWPYLPTVAFSMECNSVTCKW